MGCLKPQQYNAIIAAINAVAAPETAETTVAYSRVSNSGTIAAGAVYVLVDNDGVGAGTFHGAILGMGENVELTVPYAGLTLPAMAYNATGTEFRVVEIRP